MFVVLPLCSFTDPISIVDIEVGMCVHSQDAPELLKPSANKLSVTGLFKSLVWFSEI